MQFVFRLCFWYNSDLCTNSWYICALAQCSGILTSCSVHKCEWHCSKTGNSRNRKTYPFEMDKITLKKSFEMIPLCGWTKGRTDGRTCFCI